MFQLQLLLSISYRKHHNYNTGSSSSEPTLGTSEPGTRQALQCYVRGWLQKQAVL